MKAISEEKIITKSKKFIFYIITISFPFILALIGIEGYYAYKLLASPISSTGSFGSIDGELGWALKPNANTHTWRTDKITGKVLFDFTTYTDSGGFRSSAPGGSPQPGGIVTIGDSWTFGSAVNYEQSFPGILAKESALPLVNMGVPAYGSAQSLLLFERHVKTLRPRIVEHLNFGLWQRSLCHGETRPSQILKPCFWLNPSTDSIEILKPLPGHVEKMAALGVYPGGWLTAGNATWSYFLISRPIARFKQMLTAVGLMPGHQTEYDSDPIIGGKAISYTINRMVSLAQQYGFTFILIDPPSDYLKAYEALTENEKRSVIYVSGVDWQNNVSKKASKLPIDQQKVPGDGHFAEGKNSIIAAYLNQLITGLMVNK